MDPLPDSPSHRKRGASHELRPVECPDSTRCGGSRADRAGTAGLDPKRSFPRRDCALAAETSSR